MPLRVLVLLSELGLRDSQHLQSQVSSAGVLAISADGAASIVPEWGKASDIVGFGTQAFRLERVNPKPVPFRKARI